MHKLDGHDWAFFADGVTLVETCADIDSGKPVYFPTDDRACLGEITARLLERRLAKSGAIYVWQQIPGGRFDRFQTCRLPADLRKVS